MQQNMKQIGPTSISNFIVAHILHFAHESAYVGLLNSDALLVLHIYLITAVFAGPHQTIVRHSEKRGAIALK